MKKIRRIYNVCLGALVTLMTTACSDESVGSVEDTVQPVTETVNDDGAIGFVSYVIGSKTATRAGTSIVNRKMTVLQPTQERAYWLMNDDGSLTEKMDEQYVGVFGYDTGQLTWAEYKAANDDKEPTTNFFFNQKATVESAGGGTTNALAYEPLRFWSNARIEDDADNYEYASFWAYYPWNDNSEIGDNGVGITPNAATGIGEQKGMGSVKFTMKEDAAEQVDFLMSDLVTDCNKFNHPLASAGNPTPVELCFHHMLAQVRVYAFIQGRDKVRYIVTGQDGLGNDIYKTATAEDVAAGRTITTEFGNSRTVVEGEKIPDDTWWAYDGADETAKRAAMESAKKTERWSRLVVNDMNGMPLANARLSVSMNNIRTSAVFTPSYDTSSGKTTFFYHNAADDAVYSAPATGSATAKHYIVNPYWFTFDGSKRVQLNDTYMYDDFESTPAYLQTDASDFADGVDWSDHESNRLGYPLDKYNQYDGDASKHYNYAPCNIILAVPQVMSDDEVPNISISITDNENPTMAAKVTVNLLGMNIEWRSGFIYCYTYLDELSPGDDKVKGPENIGVIFDPTRHTDQW